MGAARDMRIDPATPTAPEAPPASAGRAAEPAPDASAAGGIALREGAQVVIPIVAGIGNALLAVPMVRALKAQRQRRHFAGHEEGAPKSRRAADLRGIPV